MYSKSETLQLRDLLWAARQVLTESFPGGLPDVRVGGDLLPLLLQGWRARPHSPSDAAVPGPAGQCDFSGFHTAVLLSGNSLVSVGETLFPLTVSMWLTMPLHCWMALLQSPTDPASPAMLDLCNLLHFPHCFALVW